MSAQLRLVEAISATQRSVADARDALRSINEPQWQDDFGPLLDQTETLGGDHIPAPLPRVADDYAGLAGLIRQIRFSDEDQDRERFRALRGARGSLLEDVRTILECAAALGLHPTQSSQPLPDTAMLETAGREGQLISLHNRIAEVETLLTERLLPEAMAGNPPRQQVTIVQHYVQDMRRYTTSIKLSIRIGDGIDLAVIERAASAMGRATVAMIDTVRAQASKASEGLRQAVTAMRKPVRKVVSGVGVLVRLVIRSDVRAGKPAPLPDDYVEQAQAMILAGVAPPAHWAPHLTELDFSGSELANLAPLARLTALQSLVLSDTQVSDLAPLARLTSLKHLYLSDTPVSDLALLSDHAELTIMVEDKSRVVALRATLRSGSAVVLRDYGALRRGPRAERGRSG